ncbi:hypothetical protein B0H34DRAFT_88887 [Crassisporium funariophilum]|nr:hypothetical protein B0H34DRAFT_88887 [Crassisporium funariophilum]
MIRHVWCGAAECCQRTSVVRCLGEGSTTAGWSLKSKATEFSRLVTSRCMRLREGPNLYTTTYFPVTSYNDGHQSRNLARSV